jgi:hypothetical protein
MGLTTPPHKKNIVKKPESMPAGRTQFRRPSKQKDLRLGTWNVLSLYRASALRNLVDMLKTYEIDILAIQDMRWIGQNILERKGVLQLS